MFIIRKAIAVYPQYLQQEVINDTNNRGIQYATAVFSPREVEQSVSTETAHAHGAVFRTVSYCRMNSFTVHPLRSQICRSGRATVENSYLSQSISMAW